MSMYRVCTEQRGFLKYILRSIKKGTSTSTLDRDHAAHSRAYSTTFAMLVRSALLALLFARSLAFSRAHGKVEKIFWKLKLRERWGNLHCVQEAKNQMTYTIVPEKIAFFG